MSAYTACKVKSKKEWADFYALPFKVYQDDPTHNIELRLQIQEELDPKKNPIAKDCDFQAFTVYKNDQISARAVAIVNPALNQKMGKSIGQIGYLEFFEDTISLKLLLDSCRQWFIEQDCDDIWTDVRFSLNYQVGIQHMGFEQNHTFLMPRQPKYYNQMLESLGFNPIKHLNAYRVELDNNYHIPDSIKEQAQHLLDAGFEIRNMTKKDVWVCLEHYNSHWNNNFAHTAFTDAELTHLNQSMGLFLDTRFCFVVEKNNNLVGYLFTFPDYNQELTSWRGKPSLLKLIKFLWNFKIKKKVIGLKTAIIGVDQDYAGKKVSSLLNNELLRIAQKNDCQYIERSWILEDNIASIKQAERLGGQLYKQFAIYEAPLEVLSKLDFRRAS